MTTLTRALFLAMLLTPSLAFAQGTYTQIDYPGAAQTACYAINTAGDVVGTYVLPTGQDGGFIYSQGSYTSVVYKNLSTGLTGINDVGQASGIAGTHGFVYDIQTQQFTPVMYPGTHLTLPHGINNAGTVTGWYYQHKSSYPRAFELTSSGYVDIDPPGGFNTYVWDLNNLGEVVGYTSTGQSHQYSENFSYYQGTYGVIHIPDAPQASVIGINDNDSTVGDYVPPGVEVAGFIYQNGILQTVQFPGTLLTYLSGINNAGEVVGTFYFNGSDTEHCFTWTPPAPAHEESKQ
jgi:hypothetical protein